MKIGRTVLDSIGNTSMIQLNRQIPNNSHIFLKLEWQNPTGSMKDRMAQAMIAEAEKDGRLPPNGTVVEYTGGSTGASLALICAVKGYKIKIISSDAFSEDKLKHMEALGAELTLIPSNGEGITKELLDKMIAKAKEISEKEGAYWTNQLSNFDHIKGYYGLGQEIWDQTDGNVDAFVHVFGSSASLQGVAHVLKEKNPNVKIFAVEPAESPIVSKHQSGAHGIDGIGVGFVPKIWNDANVDEILTVSTKEAEDMMKQLAREEGIFIGTSSGANVCAALQVAEKMKPGANIVTLAVDTGLKYLTE